MLLLRQVRWFAVPAFVAVAALVSPPSRTASDHPPASELHRIHAHFDSVLVELRARDVSALSSAQQQQRDALVRTLTAYNARGRFPRNYDFAAPTPYFVDRQTGVLCAVAHLMESTGRRDIVDRVAAQNNNVWVAELTGDTAVGAWLQSNGITLDEAARIQVPYTSAPQQAAVVGYSVGVPLLAGASLATSIWNGYGNKDGHRQSGSVLGMAAGIVSVVVGGGIASQMTTGDPYVVPSTLAALGGLSIALSVRSMVRHERIVTASRDSVRAITASPAQASIAPIIPVNGRNGAGVAVAIRF